MINFDKIRQRISEGYVSVQKHPTDDLFIYNYTQRAKFGWEWNEETTVCRGLIADSQDNILYRPFPKFFSADQTSRSDLVWSKPFTVTRKLDGSLGVFYEASTGPAVATRGAFTSPQAVKATEILRNKYPDYLPPRGITVLFEILYPENRIVCDYDGLEDLVFLAALDTSTGQDIGAFVTEMARGANWTGPAVKEYSVYCKPAEVLEKLAIPDDGTEEGVVLRFNYPKNSFTRMKIKTAEYRRLHKLVTGVSPRAIWECLRDGKPFAEIIDRVPDEFFKWATDVKDRLELRYGCIETEAKRNFKVLEDRKATALYFQTRQNPAILFAMLDQRDYSCHIWKLIKPEHERPFKMDDA